MRSGLFTSQHPLRSSLVCSFQVSRDLIEMAPVTSGELKKDGGWFTEYSDHQMTEETNGREFSKQFP